MRPASWRLRMLWRSVTRDTPYRALSSFSLGSSSPAATAPLRMSSCAISSRTSSVSARRRGRREAGRLATTLASIGAHLGSCLLSCQLLCCRAMHRHRVLVLGASYGFLLASKLVFAGHDVTLVCLPAQADLIGREGARVHLPVRGRSEAVVLDSRTAPGVLSADVPEAVDPAGYDLAALAMQEPQYRAGRVRDRLPRVGAARIPCMSIMNMPPLPYLERIPGVDASACRGCYA